MRALESRNFTSTKQIMLVGLMVQSTIDLIDEGMFNVAIPAMQEAYGLPIDILSIVVAVRYLSRIGLMPLYGFIGDRFGKKRTFSIGLAIFVLGSIISLLSPSILWLVIGRMLQGMGGGILPLSMAIISDHFSQEQRGQALGIWNASAPLGVILGPPIGGLIIESFGWKAIFIVSGLGSLIALILVLRLVPSTFSHHEERTPMDWLGAASTFTLVTGLLLATTTSSIFPFGSTVNLLYWSGTGLSLVLFLWNATKNPNPFISLEIIKNRQLMVPSIAIIFRMFTLSGTVFLMVLYLANVFNRSPREVGLFLIAQSLPIFVFVPIGGLLADRWNSRNGATLGMFIQSVGMLWLGFVDPKTNNLLLIPGMILSGLGAGLSLTPFTKGAVDAVSDEQVGLAAGLYNMIRFAGVATAAPLMGILLAAGFEKSGGLDSIADPYRLGFQILFLCIFSGTLITSRMPVSKSMDGTDLEDEELKAGERVIPQS
jgi:MFS family permease